MLRFVARMLSSEVKLLSDTMISCLNDFGNLAWVKRVYAALENMEIWDAKVVTLFDRARTPVVIPIEDLARPEVHLIPNVTLIDEPVEKKDTILLPVYSDQFSSAPVVMSTEHRNLYAHRKRRNAARELQAELKRAWEDFKQEPHPSLVYAPTTCSFTFRFWRGHMDPFVGQAAKDRDGICYFCNTAKETPLHLVHCPDNPHRELIDALDPVSLQWLWAPTFLDEMDRHLADMLKPEKIEELSHIHYLIWTSRRERRNARLGT